MEVQAGRVLEVEVQAVKVVKARVAGREGKLSVEVKAGKGC